MNNTKEEPTLRFKGFTEPWEQRKLSDEAIEMVAGGDIDKSKLDENGEFPVLANALTNDGIVGYYASEYRIKAPAVTVTGRGDVGHAKARKIDFTPVVRLLSIRSNHDVDFLENAINTLKIVIESTGVPQLTVPQLGSYEFFFPQSTEEEKAIGTFFRNLDTLITLHQRKYEKLKSIKTGFLEKMFPTEKEKFPRIRFKGFTEPWEQRKLGDLADIVGGGTPSTAISAYWGGTINWYSPIEIGNQIFVSTSQNKITNEGYKSCSAKILPIGTILFTSRAGIGKTAILAEKGCTNQGFQSIVPNTKLLDSYFVFSRSPELKRYGDITGAGSTFAEVSGKQMAKMELMMPKELKEQEAIGNLFKSLDSLITLHQRKCDLLKNIKKAFLSRMFI